MTSSVKLTVKLSAKNNIYSPEVVDIWKISSEVAFSFWSGSVPPNIQHKMFISLVYRDTPELSLSRNLDEEDLVAEKTLLVNPECHVRVMLEYIRKKCRLGIFTQFDICDEGGGLKGLFNMPTFEYAHKLFEHKKTYYIIVLKTENDRTVTVLPQVNRENPLYELLKTKVKHFMLTGQVSSSGTPVNSSPSTRTPPKKKK